MIFENLRTAFLFVAFPIFWYVYVEKKEFKKSINLLGIKKIENKHIFPTMYRSVFYAIIITLIVELVILSFRLVGIDDSTKVVEIITKLPSYMLVFPLIVAPIYEEIMFRGFLNKKLGNIISSVLFAFAHISYQSTVQLIGAFIIGLILCEIFKRSDNIVEPMITHAFYNLISLYLVGAI